jgi:hypothetical protein
MKQLATDAQMVFIDQYLLALFSISNLENLSNMHFIFCTSSVHLWLKNKRSAKKAKRPLRALTVLFNLCVEN